jgi:RNA-splicing ligase RtcB
MSRTQHKRDVEGRLRESWTTHEQATGLTPAIDARWWSGTSDISEMPAAYKNAESVRRQIKTFGLAEIVDEVVPYGCIMAGEIDWRNAGKTLGDMA